MPTTEWDSSELALEPSVIVSLVISQALGFGGEPPDAACFDGAATEDPAIGEPALETLRDPNRGWIQVAPAGREALVQAYFTCEPDLNLAAVIYFGLVRGAPNRLGCVADRWEGKLSPDLVASSLAVTRGLDDLPPATSADLAADVVACFDDVGWWTDDVELRLHDDVGLAPREARCVAEAIVEAKGVQYVVDRRLATVPVWIMSPEDQAGVDLPGRCGADLEQPRPPLHAARGTCADIGQSPFGQTRVVPCEGKHNGEVLAVFPVGDSTMPWPGYRSFVSVAEQQCSDTSLLSSRPPDDAWLWTWDAPARSAWEQGDRDLTCLLGKDGLLPWEGPSGYTS